MSWPDLPPLNTLAPFEAVVRLGSVSRAAEELRVTHGAVSRQITALERSLGVQLFDRQGRSLRATDLAVTLSAAVSRALELLSAAARETRSARTTPALVLSCEPTLLMRWLIPRLPQLDPTVNLHLSAGGGPIDLHRQGVDAAIRRTDFAVPSQLAVAPLFDEWIGPVCAPAIADQISRGDASAPVVRLDVATRPDAWRTWSRLTGQRPRRTSSRTFEHFYLGLEAAGAGLGIAIGPYALVQDDLRSGRLVSPHGFVPDGTSYVFLTAEPRDTRLTAVQNWLHTLTADSIPPRELRHTRPTMTSRR